MFSGWRLTCNGCPCLQVHNVQQLHKVHVIVQLLLFPGLTKLADNGIVVLQHSAVPA